MSADNLLVVLPYIPADTGVLEYRVYETFLSSDCHVLYLFSANADCRAFKTFPDKRAAVAFARKWMQAMDVCEYGISVVENPTTWDALFSEMQKRYKDCPSGPPKALTALSEATATQMAALPTSVNLKVLGLD